MKNVIDNEFQKQFSDDKPPQIYYFDTVQYNQNGDWAFIYYNTLYQNLNLHFYDIDGINLGEFQFGNSIINNNEGDLGVSITNTNSFDEVFIVLTYENESNSIEIVGGIVGVDGNFRRSEGWIKIFSSSTYSYSKPQIQICQNYIYVVAYSNIAASTDFEGIGSDEFARRNLNTPVSQVQDGLGYVVFNYVDISGTQNLNSPQDLEGIFVEFLDAENTQRVYMNFQVGLQIKLMGNNKVIVIFEDSQNLVLETSSSNQIVYFIINEDATLQLPLIFDNSAASYPDEEVFISIEDIIGIDSIPNTQTISFTYSYVKDSEAYFFISTVNTETNETICHKSFLVQGYYEKYLLNTLKTVPKYPNIQIQDQDIGYLSFSSQKNELKRISFYIFQYNPSTCIIDETLDALTLSKFDQSQEKQKIILLNNQFQNKYKILHVGAEFTSQIYNPTLLHLQSMMNCDTTDNINNTCTSCQPGYSLTYDGQCLIHNCGMDCQTKGQFCNFENLQCFDCLYSIHCKDNNNGSICIDNTCQNTCISSEDCASLGQICNLTNQQCENFTISSDIKMIELPIQETVPIVEANNKNTGRLELDFDVIDVENEIYNLQFLKLTMDDEDILPLKVKVNEKNIQVTLPRNTENGIKTFKLYANQLIPISNNARRNLQEYNIQQIYVEKQLRIVDTVQAYIDYQQQLQQVKEEEILLYKDAFENQKPQNIIIQKQSLDNDNTNNNENNKDYTFYYILVPTIVILFLGFIILGFLLGKKSKIEIYEKQMAKLELQDNNLSNKCFSERKPIVEP